MTSMLCDCRYLHSAPVATRAFRSSRSEGHQLACSLSEFAIALRRGREVREPSRRRKHCYDVNIAMRVDPRITSPSGDGSLDRAGGTDSIAHPLLSVEARQVSRRSGGVVALDTVQISRTAVLQTHSSGAGSEHAAPARERHRIVWTLWFRLVRRQFPELRQCSPLSSPSCVIRHGRRSPSYHSLERSSVYTLPQFTFELATGSWVGLLETSPTDEAACQGNEGIMEFEASFPSDGEAFELMEEGEGLLDDIAEFAQALDARGALAGNDRHDPACAQFAADCPGVVRLVAQDGLGASSGTARTPGPRRDAVDEGESLRDVVDVRRS